MGKIDYGPFLEAVRPPEDLTPASWCAEHVYLPDSPIGAKWDPEAGLYAVAPLDDMRDPELYEVNIVGATGMGKTALFEAALAWVVAQAPGPALFIGATNDTVKAWVKSRLMKVFEGCKEVARLLPSGKRRHDKSVNSVIFRHMAMFMGGANETNTQEKSMRYTFGDELWEWSDPILGEMLKRHHDRWNRKSLCASQGGTVGTSWHKHATGGREMRRHFVCPVCEESHEWKWELMKYETIRDEGGEIDWTETEGTVRLECPCGAEFEDTPANRRLLTDSGIWVQGPRKFVPGRVTYYVPFFWVPRIRWGSAVKEWIEAQEEKGNGDHTKLRQFIQKRLADWWQEPSDVPELRTDGDPYSRKEYADGARWEGSDFRLMSVDVQKDHFFVVVRDWKLGGNSRLIREGKVETWENLRFLQEKYEVANRFVFIDCGYLPEEVAEKRMKYRNEVGKTKDGRPVHEFWTMLMGEDSRGYHVKVRKTAYLRTYSEWVNRRTAGGIPYRYIKYSNLMAKDTLAGLMAGKGGVFGVPTDHSKAYAVQMANEQKVEVSPGKWRWKPVTAKANNHLWDCETMGVVGACLSKVLAGVRRADE